MRFICIVFLMFFSFPGRGWDSGLIQKWQTISDKYSPFVDDSSFATFWGGIRRGFAFYRPQGEMIELQVPDFLEHLPVYIDKKNNINELIIFYPGVFGKPDGRISPQVIHELESKGKHLVVIPNLLAPTYLVARPKVEGDLLFEEGRNQKKVLNEVIKFIGKENISKIHVVAESLGSFQSLMALALDEEFSFKIESLTLLWPPLNLAKAVQRFDELIGKSILEQKKCSYWWKWPFYIYETKFKTVPSGLSTEDKKCLGAWIIGNGFVDSIKETASYYFEKKSLKLQALPTTFTSFTSSVLPEFKDFLVKNNEKLSLISLLQWSRNQSFNIQLISSENDFLNKQEEWDNFKKNYPDMSENIFLFPWGGHSGPAGIEGFIKSTL